MLNKPNRNDVDDGVQDIQNDVNRLADSLEDVLKSWEAMRKTKPRLPRRKATGVAERDPGADAGSYSRKTSRL
ncbi:membrane protein [Salmonella enterica subsp. enterica]|uniref:Membrane protein n=1 Tax=Salmonella enterica I TaxID=59201 RepID=A0A379VN47_SALET|nr:membrane protein [Salmonella enterica subsp. enterica]